MAPRVKKSTPDEVVVKITEETLPEGMSRAAIGVPVHRPGRICKHAGCDWGVFGSEDVCWRHLNTNKKETKS